MVSDFTSVVNFILQSMSQTWKFLTSSAPIVLLIAVAFPVTMRILRLFKRLIQS